MLKSLTIKDIVLIKEVELDFSMGLNIITGETGTGKSLIVNSINYITGEKSSPEIVRKGAIKGIIEIVIDTSNIPSFKNDTFDLPEDEDLILRREIYASGKTRNFINDTPCSLSDLKDIGNILVDLHGQHQHQSLFYHENYPGFIDRFGKITGISGIVKDHLMKFKGIYNKRSKLIIEKKQFESKRELIEFQLNEIKKTNPAENEDSNLESEIRILENSEKLFELSNNVFKRLYEDENSLLDGLNIISNDLTELASIDKYFGNYTNEIESTRIICMETADFIRDYKSNIEFNSEKLEQLRLRLREIDILKRKYGGSITEVLQNKEKFENELDFDLNIDDLIANYDEELKDISKELLKNAKELSEKRKKISLEMEKVITEHLHHLGIKDAVFKINIERREPVNNFENEFGIINNIAEDGFDNVSFLISTIKNVEPRNLLKIASGGEISRIMLALKSALSEIDNIPVMVFDEIDSGISGRIASVVGSELKKLSAKRQILCITHLPQIAVKGESHFSIEKTDSEEITNSYVKKLTFEERIPEIARLLGGETVTEINLLNAEEMLRKDNG
ncbi:DNA repair protein RecN [candidate division KSB1 bacterium]